MNRRSAEPYGSLSQRSLSRWRAMVFALLVCMGLGCAEDPAAPVAGVPAGPGAAPPETLASVGPVGPGDLRPMVAPENFADNAELTWDSPFGPGQFWEAQTEPAPIAANTGTPGFTTVVGAYLPPDENVVVFLGKTEPGLPELDPRELTDALAVALNSFMKQEAPGVSIDPTEDQLKRPMGKIAEGELMNVRYPGASARTELGLMSFEADRLMKCLSFGKDNITRQPLTSSVPGYRNELERLLSKPSGGQSWHRFWIEPERNRLQYSPDRRTILVDTKLAVQTRYMVNSGGKLVDAAREAEPAAKEFAQHLTDHYGEFSREFAAFHKLQAFSSVTSIAQAILGMPVDSQEPPAVEIPFDAYAFVSNYRPRDVATPMTTPATVASLSQTKGAVTETLQLTGGVDLGPKRETTLKQIDAPQARSIGEAVQERRHAQRATRNQPGLVTVDGTTYQTRSVRWGTVVRGSQQDLKVGGISIVRDLVGGPDATVFGKHWQMRLPRLTESSATAKYEGGRSVPREMRFDEPDAGRSIALDKFGEMELPFGKGRYSAYFGEQQKHRLAVASDQWLLFSGEISFTKDNLGNISTVLGPDSRSVEFSPDAQHRVQLVRTATGERKYDYQPGKKANHLLRRIADDQGNAVEFEYDAQDRVRVAKGSDGQVVNYHYDPAGRLFGMKRNTGDTLTYGFQNPAGEPHVASLRTQAESPRGERFTSQLQFTSGTRRGGWRRPQAQPPVVPETPTAPMPATGPPAVIKLVRSPSADRDFDVTINGQTVEFYGKLKGAVDIAVEGGQDRQAQIDALRSRFVDVAGIDKGGAFEIDCPDPHVKAQLERFIRSEVRTNAKPTVVQTTVETSLPSNFHVLSMHTLAEGGDLIEATLNGQPIKTSRPLMDLLYSAQVEGDAAAIKELADLFRTRDGYQPGDQIVISAEEESIFGPRDQLGQLVQNALIEAKVITTNDPDRVIQKAAQPASQSLAKQVRVLIHHSLIKGVFDSAQAIVERYPNGGNDSQALVIAAHNARDAQELFLLLKKMGDAGELVGRDIVLLTCGNPELSNLVAQLLSQAKAGRVIHFSQPINQLTLVPVLEKLMPEIQRELASSSKDVNWSELLGTAIRQALEDVSNGVGNPAPAAITEPASGQRPSNRLQAPAREDLENLKLFNVQAGVSRPIWRSTIAGSPRHACVVEFARHPRALPRSVRSLTNPATCS